MANIAAVLSLNVPAITALTKGEPGRSILNGPAAPLPSIGNNGDFYIDTSTYNLYGPKNGGIWGPPTLLNNNASAPLWNSSYFTLTSLSATWSNTYKTVSPLSADWNNAYTTANSVSSQTVLQFNSGFWSSAYTTVCAFSASWGAGTSPVVLDRLNSVYSTVSANSATWNSGGGGGGDVNVNTTVRANSSYWQTTFLTVTGVSGNWNSSYTTVRNASANWTNAYTTVFSVTSLFAANSASWNNAYTTTASNSANWNSTYTTLQATSAMFLSAASFTSFIGPLTANWNNSYTTAAAISAQSNNVYTVVSSLSDSWQTFYGYLGVIETKVNTLTATGPLASITVLNSLSAGDGVNGFTGRYGSGLSASDLALIPGVTSTTSRTFQNRYLRININGIMYFLPLYQ